MISEPSTYTGPLPLGGKKNTSTSKTLRIGVASQRPKARADCRSPRRIVPWFRCCLGKKPRGFCWEDDLDDVAFLFGRSKFYLYIYILYIIIYVFYNFMIYYLDIYIYYVYIHTCNVYNRFRWYINSWSLSIYTSNMFVANKGGITRKYMFKWSMFFFACVSWPEVDVNYF